MYYLLNFKFHFFSYTCILQINPLLHKIKLNITHRLGVNHYYAYLNRNQIISRNLKLLKIKKDQKGNRKEQKCNKKNKIKMNHRTKIIQNKTKFRRKHLYKDRYFLKYKRKIVSKSSYHNHNQNYNNRKISEII